MLSHEEYVFITRRLISKHISGTKLCKIILKDNDLFGELLTEVMKADWLWDGRGNINGYRKQRFLWTLGTFRERFSSIKNKCFQYNNFDGTADPKAFLNDNNLFYEEFIFDINNSKILTEKERESLRSVFIEFNKPNTLTKKNINRGLGKLKYGYKIFDPRRIRNHCSEDSKQELSKNL